MAEWALGWLGWTEQQALATDVNAIVIAYEGRVGMLKAIFGSEEQELPPGFPKPKMLETKSVPATPPPPITPEAFDQLFAPQQQGMTHG